MHSIKKPSKNSIKEIVKLHQKKYRDKTGLFIAEGFKAVEEVLNENIEIVEIFSLKNVNTSEIKKPVTVIEDSIMEKIATTNSSCDILAIAKKTNFDLKSIPSMNKLILLDKISDPGNLGTIIRSAAAFGIDGIILYNNCVDIYSPKVIRSATGNLFKTPFFHINTIEELKKYLKTHKIISASGSQENNISIEQCSGYEKYVIMFGSEAKGLSSELTEYSTNNIRINMKKNVESLNLSVSVSVILYELSKQI